MAQRPRSRPQSRPSEAAPGVALQARMRSLELRVAALEQELANIRHALDRDQEEEIITLRDVSREQARMEIRQVFAIGGVHYMSELAEFLRLPDQLVVELCNELMAEGELEVNDDVNGGG